MIPVASNDLSSRRHAGGSGDPLKRLARRYIFGPEFDIARSVHRDMQWYPRPRATRFQWDTLCTLLEEVHAKNEFYRNRLSHVFPNPHFTLEMFKQIPPLTRSELVSSWDAIRNAGKRGRVMQRRSGGSSGMSVNIPLDVPTYCWYMATLWRGFQWWDADLTERGAILLGPLGGSFRRFAVQAKDWAMNWLRISVDDQFDRHAQDILDDIIAFSPSFIYGFPSALHRLAMVIHSHGWHPKCYPKVIVLTGEPIYPFQRRSISDAFQCPVAEEYGSGELGCIAFQCPQGSLHITVENVFIETVPTVPLAGDSGGLVLATHLRNRGFPLIRYESGDVGLVEADPCRCGRELPTLKVLGRTKDRLVSHDGAQLARPRIDRLLDLLPDALQGHVRIAHTSPGSVALQIERTSARQGLLKDAVAAAETVLGPGWHLSTVEVERLTRLPSGKLLYFQRSQAHS